MAGGPAPVELLADCARCGLEAGVVEIYDALVAACRFGLPASATCRLCGASVEGTFDRPPAAPLHDVQANHCPGCLAELLPSALDERRCSQCRGTAALVSRAEPRSLATLADVAAALDAWAERDGFRSRSELLDATFCEPRIEAIHARIIAGQRLEAVADPFANMGVRTSKSGEREQRQVDTKATGIEGGTLEAVARRCESAAVADPLGAVVLAPTDSMAPPRAPAVRAPRSAPPRAIVFPLVSVVAADGEVHPAERALVDRFLQSEGLTPLRDDEFRVHHPSEVAHFVPKERREGVVQLMCETAAADGMPDESERRVIRAYAHAWNVPEDKVDFWMWGYENMSTSLARQFWLKIRRFVLSARWSDDGKEAR